MELAEKENLVKIEDKIVKANFDYKNVDIPIGFQPSEEIFESSGERNLFQKILGEMVAKSDLEKQEIMSKVNRKQDRLNVEIRTALLLVAQEEDIELDDRDSYIKKIEKDLRDR